jgi:hypothetical protein
MRESYIMVSVNKNIKWVVVVLVMLMGGWFFWRNKAAGYQAYVNKNGGYSVNMPMYWRIEEATESGRFKSRVVFWPTKDSYKADPVNIGEMAITVVDRPAATQVMAKTDELKMWREKPDQVATVSGIVKLKSEKLGGVDAVRMAEVGIQPENPQRNWWSVTT